MDPSVLDTESPVDFVLKKMKLPEDDYDKDHLANPKGFAKIQREAIVMERLTASPRIVGIYGHCALSVLSESVPNEIADHIVPNSGHARQSDMDRRPQIQSLNNYTTTEMLDIALESKCRASLRSIDTTYSYTAAKLTILLCLQCPKPLLIFTAFRVRLSTGTFTLYNGYAQMMAP
jgi:hypothetical protein